MAKRKVAIVHDWLLAGGAEKVVQELHNMYPEAPIYTSYCAPRWQKVFGDNLRTGYLQRWPFSKLRKFIPFLRQRWFESLDLSEYDLVISSSGAEAKGVKVPKDTLHINYCHAPTHYYWNRYDEYIANPGWGIFDPMGRFGLKILLGPMRKWDLKAAQRPDFMIANSTFTRNQIKKYYDREATVIHPPVEIKRYLGGKAKERHGFVITGRHVPYKRFDLAIQACNDLGLPLTVVGSGPDTHKLKRLAGPTIEFAGYVSDTEIVGILQSAEAFLFPGLDDFGIGPVVAMAAGTPVIAYKNGGALDFVKPGKTGLFFEEQTVGSLKKALQDFPNHHFRPATIRTEAEQFSPEKFRKAMQKFIGERLS